MRVPVVKFQTEQVLFKGVLFNFYLFAKFTFIILPFFVCLVAKSFNGAQLKTISKSEIKQKTPIIARWKQILGFYEFSKSTIKNDKKSESIRFPPRLDIGTKIVKISFPPNKNTKKAFKFYFKRFLY